MSDQIPVEIAMAQALAGYDLNRKEFRKDKLDVTDDLIEQAHGMLQELQQQRIMMTLCDQSISEFVLKIFNLVSQEFLAKRDQGLFAWAPKVCLDNRERMQAHEQIATLCADSQWIPKPVSGSVILKFVPLITMHSKMYDSYWHEGHDDAGNYLGFWSKHKVAESVTIRCQIKNHEIRKGHNFNLLNYVKVQRT